MENFIYHLHGFVGGRAVAWYLALGLAFTYVGALWLLLRTLFKRPTAGSAVWTLVMAGWSVTVAGVLIAQTRVESLQLLVRDRPDLEPSLRSGLVASAFSRSLGAMLFSAPALVAAMFALFFAVLRRRPMTLPWRMAALAAALGLLSALVVFFAADGFYRTCWMCDSESNPSVCSFQSALSSLRPFHAGTLGISAVGGLGWVVLLTTAVRNARQGLLASSGTLLGSTAVLLLGVGAFIGTGGARSDTQHLVPPDSNNVSRCMVSRALREQLPAAEPDCVATDGPFVELGATQAWVDGRALTSPQELGEVLIGKRNLWKLLNPERDFVGIVLVGAPRDAKIKDLLPWLQALSQSGYAKLGAYLKLPLVLLPTRTVGVLEKERCCELIWSIDPAANAPVTRFDTWGEFTAGQHASGPVISLE